MVIEDSVYDKVGMCAPFCSCFEKIWGVSPNIDEGQGVYSVSFAKKCSCYDGKGGCLSSGRGVEPCSVLVLAGEYGSSKDLGSKVFLAV